MNCFQQRITRILLIVAALSSAPAIQGTEVEAPLGRRDAPMYDDFRQPDFPFTEATVDLREIAPLGNTDHVVPRALLLNLSPDVTVCFDTELLRVAAIWTGNSVSAESMAALSYANPLQKIRRGESDQLPKPAGSIIAANGLYPGWQWDGHTHFDDPRPVGPDARELGRGPLAGEHSRWRGVEVRNHRARLHYLAAHRSVIEDFDLREANGTIVVQRAVTVSPRMQPVSFVVAERVGERSPLITIEGAESEWVEDRYLIAHIAPSEWPLTVRVKYALPANESLDLRNLAKTRDDHVTVTTAFASGEPRDGFAVDELDFPYPNPWQRRIRPTDIDFWPNGDAAVVTFDGDVYRLRGLDGADGTVTWQRIATGLNEPQSVRIRDGEVYVFSRLGIIHLLDSDSDGVTDYYACFNNDILQSPQPRDYPLSMVVQDDGSFVITKGGIQETARTPQAGRALWISHDGRQLEKFADGLRNAYLGRDPATGLIAASDQQGNWVPATPFLLIRSGGYYGYEPGTTHVRDIEPVPLWLPHRVAQSAIDPIWLHDPRLGPMDRSVLLVDYYRPGLIRILPSLEGASPHTVGIPVSAPFETPLLKGEVNPADGQVYLVGMQIWGSLAPRIEGLSRLRMVPDPRPHLSGAGVYREGVWLRYDRPVDDTLAVEPSAYGVRAWNYRRTSDYGSGQYRQDGSPGVDEWTVNAVLWSADRQSVFLAIQDLQPTMQLEVTAPRQDGADQPMYFTVDSLTAFHAVEAGFGDVDFKQLFARSAQIHSDTTSVAVAEPTIELGRTTATNLGCMGCHSIDGATAGKSGPTWWRLAGSKRQLDTGASIIADDAYLRRAILDPTSEVIKGYDPQEAGMPPYQGVISEVELQSIILYLKSLR